MRTYRKRLMKQPIHSCKPSAWAGVQRGYLFFNRADAFVEIADGRVHHHQHGGAFAALLPDRGFDPIEPPGQVRPKHADAVLNLNQDLRHGVW